jgi:hypothetical protein
LPVIHIDLCFGKPGWVAPSETDWREKQRPVLVGDAWIADGNFHETLDLRLERADTLVVLDMRWWLCSRRALLRGFRMPGDSSEGCDYSPSARLRDEWHLAGRIWRKRAVVASREVRGQPNGVLAVQADSSPLGPCGSEARVAW